MTICNINIYLHIYIYTYIYIYILCTYHLHNSDMLAPNSCDDLLILSPFGHHLTPQPNTAPYRQCVRPEIAAGPEQKS